MACVLGESVGFRQDRPDGRARAPGPAGRPARGPPRGTGAAPSWRAPGRGVPYSLGQKAEHARRPGSVCTTFFWTPLRTLDPVQKTGPRGTKHLPLYSAGQKAEHARRRGATCTTFFWILWGHQGSLRRRPRDASDTPRTARTALCDHLSIPIASLRALSTPPPARLRPCVRSGAVLRDVHRSGPLCASGALRARSALVA